MPRTFKSIDSMEKLTFRLPDMITNLIRSEMETRIKGSKNLFICFAKNKSVHYNSSNIICGSSGFDAS